MTPVAVLTEEQIAAIVRRAVEPLRIELERLRGQNAPALVSIPEAARRLGKDVRTIQRWVKSGQVESEIVGTVRMVRLPGGLDPR